MEFSGIARDTAESVYELVDYILGLNISPTEKEVKIANVFKQVGSHYKEKVFNDASLVFDSSTLTYTSAKEIDDQAERLAKKIIRDYSLSRDNALENITSLYNSILGDTQSQAFKNALSLDKHPTLTRKLNGSGDCSMCRRTAGTHTNPSGELFKRHRKCDCSFIVSGYGSRNGLVSNYNKKGRS